MVLTVNETSFEIETTQRIVRDDKNNLDASVVERGPTKPTSIQAISSVAQQYAWGQLGSSSIVACMKQEQERRNHRHWDINEQEPYAELWVGTHPRGMSYLLDRGGTSLLEHIQSDDETTTTTGNLSFLLKVLSVRNVLSIQAHPDKKLAEQLHAECPDMYKDPNHKPEMAIALSDKVVAMCGFRTVSEVTQHFNDYPEFRLLVGIDVATTLDSPIALKNLFRDYMNADLETTRRCTNDLEARLLSLPILDPLQKLMLELNEQFPGDCGVFAPLLLNVVELNKGEALFIEANEPHAYISGDMIECMACSDNVVRAGLTPKAKDVSTLVSMLSYKCGMPAISSGSQVDSCTMRYLPNVPDFCVETITISAGATYDIQSVASPSILLTLEGDGVVLSNEETRLEIGLGSATYCSTGMQCQIMAGPSGVRLTRAFSNVYYVASHETL